MRLAGWFGSDGRRIAGNLEHLPLDLKTGNLEDLDLGSETFEIFAFKFME